MGHYDGDGSTDVAPFEAPDEEPVHEGVHWRCDEEDICRRAEKTLRLDETLAALEERIPWEPENQDAEV